MTVIIKDYGLSYEKKDFSLTTGCWGYITVSIVARVDEDPWMYADTVYVEIIDDHHNVRYMFDAYVDIERVEHTGELQDSFYHVKLRSSDYEVEEL